MGTTLIRLAAGLFGLALVSGEVLAHEGHETHDSGPGLAAIALPLGLVAASLLLGGAGVYLDRREDVDSKYSDAGIFAAVIALLAAVGLFVF